MIQGIVIHGTDSGLVRPVLDEFHASVAYLRDPSPSGNAARAVSAHTVAGPGIIARLVTPPTKAWHARTWNGTHLGIELAHADYTTPVDDQVLEAGAWECANWVRTYQLPLVWDESSGFIQHRDCQPGREDHKVDVGPLFDQTDFLNRVRKYL